MKILKYKRLSRGRYKLTLESSEITLYEDVILKNNLLLKSDIDIETFERIIEDNNKYEAYDLSLSYIEIKLRTEKEIRDYLDKKEYTRNVIDETIDKLKNNNLLNPTIYVNAFVNDKINLSLWGPFKIKRFLIELGLEENIIDERLSKVTEDVWEEKIDKIVSKRLKLLKNKSSYTIKNKLNNELFDLGYDKELINSKISNLNINEGEALKKEMDKLYHKLSKKYSKEELDRQVKQALYRKGYNISDINFE